MLHLSQGGVSHRDTDLLSSVLAYLLLEPFFVKLALQADSIVDPSFLPPLAVHDFEHVQAHLSIVCLPAFPVVFDAAH